MIGKTPGVATMAIAIGLASANAADQPCVDTTRVRESLMVSYGGSAATRVVFTPSDDGTLRATDAMDGRTLWTYRSPEAAGASAKGSYMTDARALRFDANRDGTIDISAGDKVWLYFGTGRAGSAYYALDVTDPSTARPLWHIGPDALPGVGEAWSTPTIARVRIAGETQNGEHFVLLFGGGYDNQLNRSGNRLFIVDAGTGRLLWSAGGASGIGAVPDIVLGHMRYPIAARVTAVDTNSDGFADRLYAADLGGQIWRFDIWNAHPRSTLVTGGVLASLGKADPSPGQAGESPGTLPSGADARRFFAAPDAALIWRQGAPSHYNVAIGSGDASPAETGADPAPSANPAPAVAATITATDPMTHDRFYSVRDWHPLTALAQSEYDAAPPLLDAGLSDITAAPAGFRVPADAPGWKLDLRSGTAWSGERVLTGSLTVNGVVLFTSFEPSPGGCAFQGLSRLYALKVDTAQPALDINDDGEITPEDLSMPLESPVPPGELHLELIPPLTGAPAPVGLPPATGEGSSEVPATRCRAGGEVLAHCVPLASLRRTFWRRQATN